MHRSSAQSCKFLVVRQIQKRFVIWGVFFTPVRTLRIFVAYGVHSNEILTTLQGILQGVSAVGNCKTQKFNYALFFTLDLLDLIDEWESLFRDGDEKSSMHYELPIT